MALTDSTVKAARPKQKPYKLSDDRGLYLLVKPNGARLWRFKYRVGGREKALALGAYPEVSLKEVRGLHDKARQRVRDGADPAAERRAAKFARENTFKAVALDWLSSYGKSLKASTAEKAKWIFEDHLFPHLGHRPMSTITAADVVNTLKRIEKRGRIETAHRAKWRVQQVFAYAIARGIDGIKHNPAAGLRGVLASVKVTHFAAITDPKQIGELLRAIDGYSGQPSTEYALKLAPLLFVRPGELRGARWEEFNLDGKEPTWRIPADRMKMGEEHLVPLSQQAVELLQELRPLTGPDTGLLFPCLRSSARAISNNTLNAALRRLGFDKDTMTTHGFRALASTRLHEMGFAPDVIEIQLAHAERNKVAAAYRRHRHLAHLPERRKLMQSWADYLDGLKAGANVVPIRRAK